MNANKTYEGSILEENRWRDGHLKIDNNSPAPFIFAYRLNASQLNYRLYYSQEELASAFKEKKIYMREGGYTPSFLKKSKKKQKGNDG
jgi:hypothetical protein